ncbi:putative bromodomain protein [Trichinella spiralis]|uniref:putative bromodomain protein n=1 Tax=Trichinella spiralis TaxID=6334 RepID=UPI0001EFCFC3|nr:putative bromodomain protein [Trichinella spiralis]
MQFFLTLHDKEKHQNRRNRNFKVPSAATKQKFSDDNVIHCYQEQNAGMYSDLFSLFNIFHCCHNIKFLLTICDKQRHTGTARKRLYDHLIRLMCNQEQIKYLRMFVMSHLEQTNVNMTNHGVQNETNLRTVQLMMLSVIMDIHVFIFIFR